MSKTQTTISAPRVSGNEKSKLKPVSKKLAKQLTQEREEIDEGQRQLEAMADGMINAPVTGDDAQLLTVIRDYTIGWVKHLELGRTEGPSESIMPTRAEADVMRETNVAFEAALATPAATLTGVQAKARMYQLADQNEDVGASLVRDLLALT